MHTTLFNQYNLPGTLLLHTNTILVICTSVPCHLHCLITLHNCSLMWQFLFCELKLCPALSGSTCLDGIQVSHIT